MGKFTYKDIKAIIECTPQGLKGKAVSKLDYIKVGYFQKSGTNWNYGVYVVLFNGLLYQVIVTFGEIL